MTRPGEKLYSAPAAVEKATGYRPDPSVIHRWGKVGVGKEKVKFKTAMLGGRRMASVEAVLRFIEATTLAADGESTPTRTKRASNAAVSEAERFLNQEGI
jgi:hypothetical protein